MNICQSKSLEETQILAGKWVSDICTNRTEADGAFVVGMSGHLGAGKTAFVKAVAREFGVEEEVTSPTFVLMKIYSIGGAGKFPFKRLVHIDAYRLEKREELEALRYEDVVADPANLVMMEWPENVGLEKVDVDVWMKFEIKDGTYNIVVE